MSESSRVKMELGSRLVPLELLSLLLLLLLPMLLALPLASKSLDARAEDERYLEERILPGDRAPAMSRVSREEPGETVPSAEVAADDASSL